MNYAPVLNVSLRAREITNGLIEIAQEDNDGLFEWDPKDVMIFETTGAILALMEFLTARILLSVNEEERERDEKSLIRWQKASILGLEQIGFTRSARKQAREVLVEAARKDDIWISLADDIGRTLRKGK